MRTASIGLVGLLLMIGSAAAAQQTAPPTGAPCGGPSTPVATWAQFHHDPCHTGYNPYETILSPANVGGLVVEWSFQEPGEDSYTSPAVADGEVYFGSRGAGGVYAVNATRGGVKWANFCGGFSNTAGSPAVAYGRVYVSCLDSIRALDAATGQLVWEHRIGDFAVPDITLANGAVYVASYNMGNVHFGDLSALDAGTGALQWTLTMQDWSFSTAAVVDKIVYVRCDERSLCALNAETGVILWEYTAAVGDILSPPAVANDLVYFCASNQILTYTYALNAATGNVVWQRPMSTAGSSMNTSTSTPAVANGVVYIGLGNNSPEHGEMHAMDANTGASLWSFRTAGQIASSPAVANGVVYFATSNSDRNGFSGDIYALSAAAGVLLWNYHAENPVVSSPSVVNGRLYVGSVGYMYSFHLPTK